MIDEYDDEPGCVNCEDGLVMVCCDDLCHGSGYCINGINDSTCWRLCNICNKPSPQKATA